MNDLRFAFRQLRKGPAFTVTALATVAICLGANLAIFAVIDAILLRPLPFPESDRLVTIFNTYPRAGVERDGSSLTNYYERRGNIPAFSSLSIYRESTEVVGETGSTQQEKVMRISPDFFTTLGVGPVMGRSFSEVETITPIEHHAAIVTDAYWRQRLNADPHVLGREIRVNGAPRTIVGVLPPDFRFLSSEARLVLPLTSGLQQRTPEQRHSGGGGTHMIARLKPGATIAEAQSQIDAHNAAVEKGNPQAIMMAEAGFRSPVLPLHADHVRAIRPTLWLMQGGALFLLLLGVVNLVNLLLIRASGHMKEMAIRRSMGASRRQVVNQVMVETLAPDRAWRIARPCGGRDGNQAARGAWRGSPAARGAHCVRWPAGGDWPGWRRSPGSRHRGADRVVQPEQPSREGTPLGITLGHGQSRRSTPSPWIHRRADRARVCSARQCRAARAEPEECDGRVSRLPRRSRHHRSVHAPVCAVSGRVTPARRCPRSPARIHRATAWSRRGRNDHERSAERRQRQVRDHARGICAAAGRIAARALLLQHHWRLLFGHRHSVARRTVPDVSGLSPP